MQNCIAPTPLDGITYFQPPAEFHITGRDGRVNIPWEFPIPLAEESYRAALEHGAPSYDQIGQGMFFALRQNPDCTYGIDYARVLQTGYPHIIAEIGGEAIMLDAKEVDSPYLDRKVNLLKIMALLEQDNAALWREIGRTLMEKGSRMEAAHLAVQSWYGAEKYLTRSLELAPDDLHTRYQLGETHYVLGHYDQALALWQPLVEQLKDGERRSLEARIAAIQRGELPKVPAVDYLTALSVAFEQHQDDQFYEAAAIVEDVLEDAVFCAQFPMAGVYHFLEQCYRAVNLTDKADAIRGRC
ncbi:MAG: tetratricopeptide repeat protein [Trichlorobacter sp.]|uniref:tetratricopeptide repeat protein n=1 Tax=Trichlorobacter sp. TaxID=2911007 RepID=UPI00256BDB5F|nr:tetratricopeptide repeat protein [Trichlorobacter sp.]MDK9716395.1 tetratricopeptide repeat protein [Trichlorobacter sp.]